MLSAESLQALRRCFISLEGAHTFKMSIFDGVEHFRDMSEEKPQNWINLLGIGMSTRRAIANSRQRHRA